MTSKQCFVNMYRLIILLLCWYTIQQTKGRAPDIRPICEPSAHLHGCKCISHETSLYYSTGEPLKCPSEFNQDSFSCHRNITHRSPTCIKPLRLVYPWGQEECVCRLYNYVYEK